jgi:hypothetical protein
VGGTLHPDLLCNLLPVATVPTGPVKPLGTIEQVRLEQPPDGFRQTHSRADGDRFRRLAQIPENLYKIYVESFQDQARRRRVA